MRAGRFCFNQALNLTFMRNRIESDQRKQKDRPKAVLSNSMVTLDQARRALAALTLEASNATTPKVRSNFIWSPIIVFANLETERRNRFKLSMELVSVARHFHKLKSQGLNASKSGGASATDDGEE
jgi:hypothetical protein